MAETADTLKPDPVRRRSAARLAAVQMSYQGQMSGQSVAEFLPVFLQHYSEDIRKSFRVKDIDSGHLNELVTSVESRSKELDELLAGCLASGWSLDRMTVIDRAVLRVGPVSWSACRIFRPVPWLANMRPLPMFAAAMSALSMQFWTGWRDRRARSRWEMPTENSLPSAEVPQTAMRDLFGLSTKSGEQLFRYSEGITRRR